METQENIGDVDVHETFVVKTDAGELCRLCANTDNQFIPIFQGEGLEHNLSLKIERHLPIIKVTEADKLPLQICYQCASTLISWHNLYEGCRVADKRLRELIAVDDKLYQEDDSCGDFADDFRDDYDDDTPVNLPTETPTTSNLESITFKDNSTKIPTLSETKLSNNETELDESDERLTSGEKTGVVVENENQISIRNTRKADVSAAATTTTVVVGKRTPKKIAPAIGPLIIVTNFSPATSVPLAKTDAINNVITIENTRSPAKIKHVCIHCSKAFPSKTAIEKHFKDQHSIAKSRLKKNLIKKDASASKEIAIVDTERRIRVQSVCSFCSKKFRSKISMEKHVKEMHSTATATTSENIDKSMPTADTEGEPEHSKVASEAEKSNNVDDESHYICANCGQKFSSKINLNRHLKRYTKKYADMCVCDVCGKKFTTPYSMRNHRQFTHANPFKQDEFWEGGAPATTPATASAPEEDFKSMEVMVEGKRMYQCDQCHYKTPVRTRIRMHYRIHSGERPYFCEKCGRQFNTAGLLRNHLLGVHEGIRKFPCDICGKKFATKHYADEHRRIHTGEKPFVCDLCGSAYTHLTSLLTHKNRHNAEPQFKCPWCPLSFVYRGSLTLHKKRHTGDLSHKCKECGKAFIDKQHLNRHLAVHSDDRPFICNICGATFKLSKYLGSHKKTHRKEMK